VPPEPVPPAETLPISDTAISAAVAACVGDAADIGGGLYFTAFTNVDIADGGHSVILDGDGGFDIYDCIRGQLSLAEWTRELMSRTTSQYGLVSVELESGYTVRWSYHPDNGPLGVINDEDAG
jgi:hypothetical protein